MAMPHQRKKSITDRDPPKRRAANRRKAKPDATSEMYRNMQEGSQISRSKQPRAASGDKRKRSGPARKQRGKKIASAKRGTRRRNA
jgi:hypothetical protein